MQGDYERVEVDLDELNIPTYVDQAFVRTAKKMRQQREETRHCADPEFDPRLLTCIIGTENYVFK